MKTIFDVEKLARESDISKQELAKIWKQVRKEFPNDQLMQELHIVRAVRARERSITQVHA